MNETSFRGFLGIDVSKDKFDAYCIDIDGEKHFYLSCPMDRKGFEKLVSRLKASSIPQENLLIGMESAACYHMNLFSFLLAGGIYGGHHQSSAHFQLREDAVAEDQDRQEGCRCHRAVSVDAHGYTGTDKHLLSRLRSSGFVSSAGESAQPDDGSEMRYEADLDDYISGAGETDRCFHEVHSEACEPFSFRPCHCPGRPGRDKPTFHGSLHGKKFCKDHTGHYPGGTLFSRNDESFKGADPQTEGRCVDSSGGPSERTDGHDD
jgi:hypothetical protein